MTKAPLFYGSGNIVDMRSLKLRMARCPHPNKLRFATEADAIKKADSIGGMDVYHCRCGMYHMTTRPRCPICGSDIDDEGWGPDCGCFAELHFGD